jgi:hypothetical protein
MYSRISAWHEVVVDENLLDSHAVADQEARPQLHPAAEGIPTRLAARSGVHIQIRACCGAADVPAFPPAPPNDGRSFHCD